MNRVTESSIWTEFLLNILSYEKVDFIQSRIIRYFTILVIVLGANINLLKLNELTWLKIIIIVLVILLGLLIFKFNDIYTKFSNSQIHELIPKLENDLYRDLVFKTLSNSRLMYYYEIEKKRKSIVLQLKKSSDQIDLFEKYARIIEFIPVDSNQFDLARIFNNRIPKTTEMKVLISQHIPKLWEQNEMKTLGIYFVYAECEEDILDAIQMLQPFVSGVQQLNKMNLKETKPYFK